MLRQGASPATLCPRPLRMDSPRRGLAILLLLAAYPPRGPTPALPVVHRGASPVVPPLTTAPCPGVSQAPGTCCEPPRAKRFILQINPARRDYFPTVGTGGRGSARGCHLPIELKGHPWGP